MNRISQKMHTAAMRKLRVRAALTGTAERPRLSINVSNKHVQAQIIDDTTHQTLAYVSTVGQKAAKGTMTERSAWVGTELAKKAKAAKVKTVVFDRGARLYHGRVKALADAARAGGLEF